MRYLITGGCGFIGTALINKIVNEQPAAKIRVLDNLSVGSVKDLARVCSFDEFSASQFRTESEFDKHQLIVGDIKDYDICKQCCDNIDVVVHLAANTGVGPSVDDPRRDMEINIIGTFNMLEAARTQKVERFIFASSGAPIGEIEPPIHEKLPPRPVSPYGASKLSGEGYCSAYFRTYGLNTIVLRFGNAYGPGSMHKSSVVAKFIKNSLRGDICEIYGDGTQTRDFIYISDLIEAILKSSESDCGGEVFQIATNREHTLNEVASMLKAILLEHGQSMSIRYGNTRIGDVMRNYSDTSKARAMLGWQAVYDLPKGLAETVAWFINNM